MCVFVSVCEFVCVCTCQYVFVYVFLNVCLSVRMYVIVLNALTLKQKQTCLSKDLPDRLTRLNSRLQGNSKFYVAIS